MIEPTGKRPTRTRSSTWRRSAKWTCPDSSPPHRRCCGFLQRRGARQRPCRRPARQGQPQWPPALHVVRQRQSDTSDHGLQHPPDRHDRRAHVEYFTGDIGYPFGYGQSYDNFGYSDIHVYPGAVTADGTIRVTAKVTNEGATVGATVPQLYVTTPFEPASPQRPVKRLEGFDRITLQPGETKTVSFSVKASALAFWNETENKYVVDSGDYGLQVGASSADADIELTGSVKVFGHTVETPAVVTAKPVETAYASNHVRAAGDVRQQHHRRPATDRVHERPEPVRLHHREPEHAAAPRAGRVVLLQPARCRPG